MKRYRFHDGGIYECPAGDYVLLSEVADELDRLTAERNDLAILVWRLSYMMPDAGCLKRQAIDYLKRKGLQGSILREAADLPEKELSDEPSGEKRHGPK